MSKQYKEVSGVCMGCDKKTKLVKTKATTEPVLCKECAESVGKVLDNEALYAEHERAWWRFVNKLRRSER